MPFFIIAIPVSITRATTPQGERFLDTEPL